MTGGALAPALLLTTVVAGLGSALVAWAGPLDQPRERGLHQGAVATSGGVAMVAGVGAGLWLLARATGESAAGLAGALGLATLMGLLGALDDLWDFGAKVKLLVQAAAALAFALMVARIEAIPLTAGVSLPLGPWFGALGTALWIVVVGNAVNFMDGANGLAAGAVAIASTAFGVACLAAGAPALGGVALILAAAQLGFLPWNLGGRLFQGDAGALFSSTLLAALAVVGAGATGRGAPPLWVAPLALLPMLTDVLLTLLWRARRRRPLLHAHREHLYQLWLGATGRPHGDLAWRAWLIGAVYGGAAIESAQLSPTLQALGFALLLALSVTGWLALRRGL